MFPGGSISVRREPDWRCDMRTLTGRKGDIGTEQVQNKQKYLIGLALYHLACLKEDEVPDLLLQSPVGT